jgi:hypothetical protein
MTTRRWIRLDIGWDDSEWVAELSPLAQLAWIKLLCHAKRDGIAGTCKALVPKVAARRWGVPLDAIQEMLDAGRREGAIHQDNGDWSLTAWDRYQVDNSNAARQRRWRERQRNAP